MKKDTISLLSNVVCDYLRTKAFSKISEYTFDRHWHIVRYFVRFASARHVEWDDLFADSTIDAFLNHCTLNKTINIIRCFSRFLYDEGYINKPAGKYHPILPEIFNRHLSGKASLQSKIYRERIVLTGFSRYLEKINKTLTDVNIEDVDSFLSEQYSHLNMKTQSNYRSALRVFLRELYVKGIIRKNLAPLIVNRRIFAMTKPPRFLRSSWTKKLFGNLKHTTKKDLRANAMLYLAYTIGLRPTEISMITLDDISFKQAKITLHTRKNCKPVTLPLPEKTLKAITAYIVGARPTSKERTLFLYLKPEYKPLTGNHVAKEITRCIRRAGVNATSYCMRHTYAQNLLEQGVSIFEIKEMMGHDNIQTTQIYLHINIKLMREALFNETF
jgi:site-specific recombinase XerD